MSPSRRSARNAARNDAVSFAPSVATEPFDAQREKDKYIAELRYGIVRDSCGRAIPVVSSSCGRFAYPMYLYGTVREKTHNFSAAISSSAAVASGVVTSVAKTDDLAEERKRREFAELKVRELQELVKQFEESAFFLLCSRLLLALRTYFAATTIASLLALLLLFFFLN